MSWKLRNPVKVSSTKCKQTIMPENGRSKASQKPVTDSTVQLRSCWRRFEKEIRCQVVCHVKTVVCLWEVYLTVQTFQATGFVASDLFESAKLHFKCWWCWMSFVQRRWKRFHSSPDELPWRMCGQLYLKRYSLIELKTFCSTDISSRRKLLADVPRKFFVEVGTSKVWVY